MHYLLVTRREDGSVSIARFQEMLLIKWEAFIRKSNGAGQSGFSHLCGFIHSRGLNKRGIVSGLCRIAVKSGRVFEIVQDTAAGLGSNFF